MSERSIQDIGVIALCNGLAFLVLSMISIISICFAEVVAVDSVTAAIGLFLVGMALSVVGVKCLS